MKRIISLVLMMAMLFSLTGMMTAQAENIVIYGVTDKHAGGIPTDREDDYVYTTIRDKIGVEVILDDLQDYDTALGARIVGGEIPDVMWLGPDQVQNFAASGYLKDISEIKGTEFWNHLLEAYGDNIDIPSNYYDGGMYCFPAAQPLGEQQFEIYVRGDWNEKYGLKVPTTVDELYDYCMDIVSHDYDGNGVIDTIGLTSYGLPGLACITAPYDVGLGNYLLIRDGKVTNSVLQPRMVEALTMLKKFYDSNLLDPGLMSNSSAKATVFSCNVGVSAVKWSNVHKQSYIDQWKAVCPEATYDVIEALDAGEGPRFTIVKHDVNVGDKLAVSADISDEKFEALLKVLDYMCTEEGKMLVYMGLEGRHWNYDENGMIKLVPENAAETNYVHEYQWLGRDEMTYLAAKFPEASKEVAWGLHYNILEYFNTSVIVPDDFNLADMESYINTQLIAFYKGERDLAEYDQFIQELYDSYDFGEYMNLATEQLVALGLANE
ncbi:MAG: extracellular solute-binding protein [Clostridia bacterium]|nr:extracellular solute-binding protein [Clostridia bacterium]